MVQDSLKKYGFLRSMVDAFPHPVLVLDSEMRIIIYNDIASSLTEDGAQKIISKKTGDALRCLTQQMNSDGCGKSRACKKCVINQAVNRAFKGYRSVRRKARFTRIKGNSIEDVFFLITTSMFQYKDQEYVLLTLENMRELLILRDMVPICSSCKKIRDDKNFWERMEVYLRRHLDLDFTHTVCPQCMDELYPQYKSISEMG